MPEGDPSFEYGRWIAEVTFSGHMWAARILGPQMVFERTFSPEVYDFDWAKPLVLPTTKADEEELIDITMVILNAVVRTPAGLDLLDRTCKYINDPVEEDAEVLWGSIYAEADSLLQSVNMRSGWLLTVLAEVICTQAAWQRAGRRYQVSGRSWLRENADAVARLLRDFADEIRAVESQPLDAAPAFETADGIGAALASRIRDLKLSKGKAAPQTADKARAFVLHRIGEVNGPLSVREIARRLRRSAPDGRRRVQQWLGQVEELVGIV